MGQVVIAGIGPEQDSTLSVVTDRLDYAPGQTAVITSVVSLGQTVEFQVSHVDGPGADGIYGTEDDVLDAGRNAASRDHDPVRVTDGGPGDADGSANGSITYPWFVNPDDSLGERFRITAREVGDGPDGVAGTPDDATGGAVAYATFTDSLPAPIQTYFVPLPQQDLFSSLSTIGGASNVGGDVLSAIGIAVAAPGTIIYYDHWEDGYEANVTAPTQATTEIWGDGNIANGAAPGVVDNAHDVFVGGDVVDLINAVPIPRDPNTILFDGGDRIQASFPIAVTTGSYAEDPGSYLAGAVELHDTDSWGTSYTIPIGENTPDSSGTHAFQYTAVYVMAGSDNTTVTINGPHATSVVLDRGETLVVEVNQGNTVTSSQPVQAQLVTGDIGSSYEMRWYSLTPRSDWSHEYYAPVAEEQGSTGFWFYNPNNAAITIHYDSSVADDQGNFVVAGNGSKFIEVDNGADIDLPSGVSSGLHFFSVGGEDFFALSQIDADDAGQTFEWGTRLLAPDELSSQVLVGLGIGNSHIDPNRSSPDIVWVTPVADAKINIDFDGDGVVDKVISASRLETIKVFDDKGAFGPGAEGDQDMSGATIFAVDAAGNPVDIAVAWGQDPSKSGDGDQNALDLGTLVPPLPGLTASKTASLAVDNDNDGRFDPGDTIQYTITVLNFTRVDVPEGGYNLIDNASPVFDDATYIAGSTHYTYATAAGPDGLFGTGDDLTTTVSVPDNGSGTAFPLDATPPSGFNSTDPISGFERQTYTFQVQIKDFADLTPGATDVLNTGALRVNGESVKDLDASVPLDFDTSIDIVKFTNDHDVIALLQPDDPVTWKYVVTNPGDVPLAHVVVTDDNGTPGDASDDFAPSLISKTGGDQDNILEPGETWTYTAQGTAETGFYRNNASVTGDPVYGDGTTPVDGLASPTDSDVSRYIALELPTPDPNAVPSYSIQKTVTDVDGEGPSGIAENAGDVITYEILVTNDGGKAINGVVVTDPLLQGSHGTLNGPVESSGVNDGVLDVGEAWLYTGTYTVQQADLDTGGDSADGGLAKDGDIDNTATVSSPDLDPENASAVALLGYDPAIHIEKSTNGLDADTLPIPILHVGDPVTWRYEVTNPGNVSLTNVVVTDDNGTPSTADDFVPSLISKTGGNQDNILEPGETWTYEKTGVALSGLYHNVATVNGDPATVVGTPEPQTDSDPSHYFAFSPESLAPAYSIDKTVTDVDGEGPNGIAENAGDVIKYAIKVTNDGGVPLPGVTVSDPLLQGPHGTLSAPVQTGGSGDHTNALLDVGEIWTYTGSYTVQQADLDTKGDSADGGDLKDGDIDNTATVLSSVLPDERDSAVALLRYDPAIHIEKSTNGLDADAPPIPILHVGDPVTWRYDVTNPGNVSLTNIVVTDDNGTPSTADDFVPSLISKTGGNQDNILEPGETWTYEKTGVALSGLYHNVATVTGDPATVVGTPEPQTDSDPSHYFAFSPEKLAPAYSIDKTVTDVDGEGPNGIAENAGDIIKYAIKVTNDGGVPLPGVTVSDPLLQGPHGTLSAPVQTGGSGDHTNAFLDVGEIWTYTGTYTVQQADLDTKGDSADGGDLKDGDVDNTATVSSSVLPDVRDSAVALLGYDPDYTIDKTVVDVDGEGPNGVAENAGDVVTYSVVVRNTGNVDLSNVIVSDPLLQGPHGTLSAPVQSGGGGNHTNNLLEVGESWTYTGTYTVQQADLDTKGDAADGGTTHDGDIDNTATVHSDQLPDESDSAAVPLLYDCGFKAVKSVLDVGGRGPNSGVDAPGEAITYQIVLTNTGNLNLTGVKIDDPLLEGPKGALSGPTESMNANGILEVGEHWTYTGSYTVQKSDIYGIDTRDFHTVYIRNAATFTSDQGCETSSNTTRTGLFTGEIICGTKANEVINGQTTGVLAPTNRSDIVHAYHGNDTIDALGGNDWINGGAGTDRLKGGSGNDSFAFTSMGKKNVDKIVDFNLDHDRIVLHTSLFEKLESGPLDRSNFAFNRAKDKNDYIVYDEKHQTLIYDKNGDHSGGEHVFAKLKGDGLHIDASDFFVV